MPQLDELHMEESFHDALRLCSAAAIVSRKMSSRLLKSGRTSKMSMPAALTTRTSRGTSASPTPSSSVAPVCGEVAFVRELEEQGKVSAKEQA